MSDSTPSHQPQNPGVNPDLGEQHDVTELHAALLREKPEPKEGFEPLNLWLVALTGGLLFWGGYYLANFSGRFEATEYSEFPGARRRSLLPLRRLNRRLSELAPSSTSTALPATWRMERAIPP